MDIHSCNISFEKGVYQLEYFIIGNYNGITFTVAFDKTHWIQLFELAAYQMIFLFHCAYIVMISLPWYQILDRVNRFKRVINL